MKRIVLLILIGALMALTTLGVSAQAAPDTIVLAWSRNPESLFYDFASTTTASYAMGPIYNGLVGTDPTTGDTVPQLATSWDVSADQLTWTFHLRQGVLWHDGQPFTADDVAFTYEFPSDPKYQGSAFDPTIQGALEKQQGKATTTSGIKVIDDHTISITTTAPNALFLQTTAQRYIVPKHILGSVAVADLGTSSQIRSPIGTGPYQVVKFTPDDSIVYKAFDQYWGDKPKVTNYIWRIIPDESVQVTELINGTIDIQPEVPPDEFGDLKTTDGITALQLPGVNTPQLLLNEKKPLFADARTRQALYYAIDRQGLVTAVAGGLGSVYDTETHPSLPEFDKDLKTYPYDPDQAKALLAQVGWRDDDKDGTLESHGIPGLTDGTPFTFELGAPSNPPLYGSVAQVVQQNLAQIGIKATINLVDFGVFFSTYLSATSDYTAAVSGWFNLLIPPQGEFESSFATNGPNTQYVHYSNQQLDDLVAQARSTFDPAKRNPLYYQIQEIIQKDAPIIFLLRPDTLSAYNSKLVLPKVGALTTLMDTVSQWSWQQ